MNLALKTCLSKERKQVYTEFREIDMLFNNKKAC